MYGTHTIKGGVVGRNRHRLNGWTSASAGSTVARNQRVRIGSGAVLRLRRTAAARQAAGWGHITSG